MRRQKTEAAWPCLWCTMSARRWQENTPRQSSGNGRERYQLHSTCLRLGKDSGENLQLYDHDSPSWQVQSVEQRRWLWLFPDWEREYLMLLTCWGKCPGSDSPAFFDLSKITQPNPKCQRGALWFINSSLDLSNLGCTGATLATCDL